jgi:hypothetical protein
MEAKTPLQNIAELHHLVSLYQESLKRLMKQHEVIFWWQTSKRICQSNQIISVLHLRDEIEQIRGLAENKKINDLYHDIVVQDAKLKKIAHLVAASINFTEIRSLIKPPIERWWWYPPHYLDKFDPLLSFFSMICLIGTLALAIDLVPRFFAGGPNVWGGIAAVAAPLASFFFGKEALEKAPSSKIFLENITSRLNITAHWRQEVVFALSLIFLGAMGKVYYSRSEIAKSYYCLALVQVKDEVISDFDYRKMHENCKEHSWQNVLPKLTTAESKLKVATEMDSTNADVHFLLGRIYELRQDLDLARAEYKTAMVNTHKLARIRIAQLYLFEEEEKSANIAVSLLVYGKDDENNSDQEYRQSVHTSLAWGRLLQRRYENALTEIDSAKSIYEENRPKYDKNNDRQPALFYCINAAVLEEQKNYSKADTLWNQCFKATASREPEGDFWETKYYKCLSPENRANRSSGHSTCLSKEDKKTKEKDNLK